MTRLSSVIRTLIFSVFLTFLSPMTFADEPNGWYAGAGFGISDGRADPIAFPGFGDDEESEGLSRSQGSEIAFRTFFGKGDMIDIGPVSLGAELGYANLGDLAPGVELDAIDLTAVGTVNLGDTFSLHGRIGAAHWDAIDDDTAMTYAVGGGANIGSLQLRLEGQRYDDIVDNDVDVVMVSAIHRF